MATCRVLMLVLLLAMAGGCARTSVEQTRWHDQAAYRLSNGRAEAIIVPAWRRVMHYGVAGGPNLLWTGGPAEIRVGPADWANYGGEKAWLWPQDQWIDEHGKKRDWPPPGDHAAAPPMEVVYAGGGRLTLRSPGSPLNPHGLLRTYTLDDGGRLVIDTRLERGTYGGGDDWAIWSIAQIHRPQQVVAKVGQGAVESMKGNQGFSLWDGVAIIPAAPPEDVKVGLDAERLTAEYADYSLVMQIDPAGTSAGRVQRAERAQVYVTPVKPGVETVNYVELEFTSARLAPEAPGPTLRVVLSIEPRK